MEKIMKIFSRTKVRAYTCGRVHTLYDGDGLVAKLCPTLVTPWTVAHQAPLSMGFSRQEHWSGLPFPPPMEIPNPGIKPVSPALACGFFTTKP